jgi:hypothetical protein
MWLGIALVLGDVILWLAGLNRGVRMPEDHAGAIPTLEAVDVGHSVGEGVGTRREPYLLPLRSRIATAMGY